MMTHSRDDFPVPAQTSASALKGSAWRGILIGLIPLGLLLALVAVTLLLTTLARLLMGSAGFYAQQQAAVIVLIAGLILASGVYVIALWRVVRRVATWQHVGEKVQARATLWALGTTALVVVIPVLLTLLLPQHPAP